MYVRKSTDEEDRQVLSLEAQLTELKEFAARENLEVIETFVEKKTAKVPGRKVFNEMLAKIESGGLPLGILAWHPDRLARNSIDGGKLIYMLDTGKLAGLKFPTFAYDNSPSGKFFLSIAFSNAKYYVDNLSENLRRGVRAKLRRGEWPGQKPLGYLYDHRKRNIVPDPEKALIVKKVFEEYATGKHNLQSIATRLSSLGVASRAGKPWSNSAIVHLLTNQLYCGLMKWLGEVYEGNYEPLVSRATFAAVQKVLAERARPRKTRVKHDFPFRNLFRCKCGGAITAQWAKGNGGTYRYYRCSKKFGPCSQPYMQEKELTEKVADQLQTIALPADWANEMLEYLEKEETKNAQSADAFVKRVEEELRAIQEKLDKLLEGYLDGMIDGEEYRRKKEDLLKQKISLKQEKDSASRTRTSGWVEPTRAFIKAARDAQNLASAKSPAEISQFIGKIGTNRLLVGKQVAWNWVAPFDFLAENLGSLADPTRRVSHPSPSKNLQNPIWWAREESNLRPRHYQ